MARRRLLPMAMTVREAHDIAGALGKPSKLPGFSYGLNARLCRRGSAMRGVPGSICSTCYAMNDFYASWTPVAKGHAKRHDGLEHPRWTDAMVTLVSHYCKPPEDWFRWHDSGDIQSVDHLDRIFQVCERTPAVRHWLPTREYEDVAALLERKTRAAMTLARSVGCDTADVRSSVYRAVIPRNLTIRLSATMIDSEAVVPAELAFLPTSTVQTAAGHPILTHKGAIECRAVEARDNRCGPCRACWDDRVTNVSYPQH